jgi:ABC-type arginine/histidine transport system permease subunit
LARSKSVVYETYIVAALIYLAMSYALVFLFRKLEFRWTAHLRERPRGPVALLRV